MASPTDEHSFELTIVNHLAANGYRHRPASDYDDKTAVVGDDFVEFVRKTQPRKWSELVQFFGADTRKTLVAALVRALDQDGTLAVLRRGLSLRGVDLRAAYFKPGMAANPDLFTLYDANQLTVMRQVHHNPAHPNRAIDLVLFINGVPVVTAELKNGNSQKVEKAVQQYRQERDPDAPLFRWQKRALVHFAADTESVQMTTRLRWADTDFLPFNRGHEHGAGNPAVEGKNRTCYLYEETLSRESLLDLVHRFIHLQTETEVDPDTRKTHTHRFIVFPRYHQLDCVRKLVRAARENGPGTNYLVQHSAGSGKSNSIGWLAHHLQSLHDAADRKVFDKVLVITDRRVLDRQLQETVSGFDHTLGVVQKIDKNSAQLEAAMLSDGGSRIIVTTIHKFAMVGSNAVNLPHRRYAVIVDEAHGSQSGDMSKSMKGLLSRHAVLAELVGNDELDETDAKALENALKRGKQPNLSYFAFTATPKPKTLELFGHKDPETGEPAPFHLYSMRQAIQEGFIVDVLRGYVTYQRYFELNRGAPADPTVHRRKASAALMRLVNADPNNIADKAKIIVDHFMSIVARELDGRAKGMVVTGSRLDAVLVKQAIDAYLAKQGIKLGTLVAFSGEVIIEHPDKPPDKLNEAKLNPGVRPTEIAQRFASRAYRLLIVANKFQTGFDEKRLCAMYVARGLSGVQAVQTLSRLNRRCGKETKPTFVLDFINEREAIRGAFADYYTTTGVDEPIDPKRVGALKTGLDDSGVYTQAEVDRYAELFLNVAPGEGWRDNGPLNACVNPAVDRFKALEAGAQAQFRSRLRSYLSLYQLLSQTQLEPDAGSEKLYMFGRLLIQKLPGAADTPLDLGGVSVRVKYVKKGEGDLKLDPGEGGVLKSPKGGEGNPDTPFDKLSQIIARLNKQGVGHFTEAPARAVVELLKGNADLAGRARDNALVHFKTDLAKVLPGALAGQYAAHPDFVRAVAQGELKTAFEAWVAEVVYAHFCGTPDAPVRFEPAPPDAVPFVDVVPRLELKVAAGGFSPDQAVGSTDCDWVRLTHREAARDLFVAQVHGASMDRHIPDGAWCLWRLNPTGPYKGKIVLAQHRDIQDDESGGQYTVKRFDSENMHDAAGKMIGRRFLLRPESYDPKFEAIEIVDDGVHEVRVVAEFLEILSGE